MPKTPDETKKGLEEEIPVHYHIDGEPRLTPRLLMDMQWLHKDALALIQQLEAERDAAVKDLHYLVNHPQSAGPCYACKHTDECYSGGDCDPVENDRWEWRGVQKEDSAC